MKYFKILFSVFAVVFSINVCTADLMANVVDTSPEVDGDSYPYYVSFSRGTGCAYIYGDKTCYKFTYTGYFYSSTPVMANGNVFYSTGDGSNVRYGQLLYSPEYTVKTGKAVAYETNFFPFYEGSLSDVVLSTNYSIYDANGNVAFRAPLLTAKSVEPIVTGARTTVMTTAGSTICLVVLGISLVVLVTGLRKFLNS